MVAEGVEQASSWNTLRRLGCDLIQGYFVSKAMPMPEFTAWSLARNAKTAATKPEAEAPLRTDEVQGDPAEPMTDHPVLAEVAR